MKKIAVGVVIALILFFGWFGVRTYIENIPQVTPDKLTNQESQKDIPLISTFVTGLEVPWALAHLPDGRVLVTERFGRVRLVGNDGKLNPKPIITIPQVKQTGESGLHGIALHPKYPEHPYVYLYYTYSSDNDSSLNRVSRFIFKNEQLLNEEVIVDQIPGAIFHDGGRIKFGPDGYLYITTGDALNPSLAQDKNTLAGKILRVTEEGRAAPDNPFDTLIFSYGHRNPQGITWDDKGNLWETEHGQTTTDEVNFIEAGKNYGWPIIRGDQTQQGMVIPKIQSGSQTWAPAGAAFYNGYLYFGGLRGQALFQLHLDTLELKEHFKGQFGRIRDVVIGPDNILYITTSNKDGRGSPAPDDDKIIRVNPAKLKLQP